MIVSKRNILVLAGAIITAASALARQSPESGHAWQIITDDFISHPADAISAITDQAVVVTSPAGDQTFPLARLLEIRRSAAAPSGTCRFVAAFSAANPSAAERFAGEPQSSSAGAIQWTEPLLGKLNLPTNRLTAIWRASDGEPAAPAANTEDIVQLANGDSLHGIVTNIAAAGIDVQDSAGNTSTAPLSAVASATFASVQKLPTTAPSAHGLFRITLADGTALSTADMHLDRSTLSLTGAITPSVPLSAVTAIEHLDGPVVWLSSLMPARSEQTPWLSLSFPARANASVTGGPIRFAGQTFTHGWGVHARSALVFNIDPSFKRFRTTYAVDGDQPYADLTVRIRLDGKIVHEQPHLRAGQMPTPVTLDVSGHKELALEVDFGSLGGVQGRMNWIEPAFLRSAASAEPPAK